MSKLCYGLILLLLLQSLYYLDAQFVTSVGSGINNDKSQLLQIHVITRHGSRHVLQKDADNNLLEQAEKGPSLTALGEKQLYDQGRWLRQEYGNVFPILDPYQVSLESSALERTIISANALAMGMWPNEARDPFNETQISLATMMRPNVPVFMKSLVNDVQLRAYDKCPTYHQRLLDLYQSNVWKDLEAKHDVLLTTLGNDFRFRKEKDPSTGKIPLKNVWNVYDSIVVAKTDCELDPTSQACLSHPDSSVVNALDDEQWDQFKTLANQAELLRYNSETAGVYIGGNLMEQMLNRMVDAGPKPQFFLYSAHYPTILGFLAALNDTFSHEDKIPEYGDALIVEVHKNSWRDDDLILQLLYKPTAIDQLIILPNSCSFASPDCQLFRTMQQVVRDQSLMDWCRECDNQSADVCLQFLVDGLTVTSGESTTNKLQNPVVAGTLCGLMGGIFLSVLTTWFCLRRTSPINILSPSSTKVII